MDEYLNQLEAICAIDVLSETERRKLNDLAERRLSQLNGHTQGNELGEGAGRWMLRRRLHDDMPSLLLVDGYNVLLRYSETFGVAPGSSPREEHRKRLIEPLLQLSKSHKNLQIRLFFDSPTHSTQALAPGMVVEYSGGTGDHKADLAIESFLCGGNGPRPDKGRFIVTDDWGLRTSILGLQAKYVAAGVLVVLLHDHGYLA